MIHYSKSILNNIIDSSSDEELLKNVKQFEDDINMIFTYFAYSNISLDYVKSLLNFKTNKCAFWSENKEFNIRDCTSCMIYANNKEKAYIMLICTHNDFKNKGFGKKLINQFANDMRNKGIKSILLSSVEEYVSYYQKLGFEAIDDNLEEYPYLKKFEKVSNDKITTIMELQL
jgi:N-acetylglutamate synthase-like GNAT family acetyltransferase